MCYVCARMRASAHVRVCANANVEIDGAVGFVCGTVEGRQGSIRLICDLLCVVCGVCGV